MKPKELAKKIANRLKDINNPEMLDGDMSLELAEDLIFQELYEARKAEQSKTASERTQKRILMGEGDVK